MRQESGRRVRILLGTFVIADTLVCFAETAVDFLASSGTFGILVRQVILFIDAFLRASIEDEGYQQKKKPLEIVSLTERIIDSENLLK